MFHHKKYYPAIFRVLLGLLILIDLCTTMPNAVEIYQSYGYRIVTDTAQPLLTLLRDNIHIFLSIYIVVTINFMIGYGKHIASLLLFLFFYIDFMLMSPSTFWGDYVMKMNLLFFIFVDSFKVLSVGKTKPEQNHLVSRLAILSIMLHLCLIYSINAWHKINNTEWIEGTALAYFFEFSKVLDVFNIGRIFLNQPNIIKILTWLVLAFQITFPIAIWFKKINQLWIIMGVILHIGMAFTLQLYKFECIMILMYGFFIEDKRWGILLNKLKIIK